MTYREILKHCKEAAKNYDDLAKFIEEFPHEEWMDAYADTGAEGNMIDEILTDAFNMSRED